MYRGHPQWGGSPVHGTPKHEMHVFWDSEMLVPCFFCQVVSGCQSLPSFFSPQQWPWTTSLTVNMQSRHQPQEPILPPVEEFYAGLAKLVYSASIPLDLGLSLDCCATLKGRCKYVCMGSFFLEIRPLTQKSLP